MTSGGNNLDNFRENQLTKFAMVDSKSWGSYTDHSFPSHPFLPLAVGSLDPARVSGEVQ